MVPFFYAIIFLKQRITKIQIKGKTFLIPFGRIPLLLLLILLGIAIPAIELFLLIWLAGVIGFWQTIGIIVVTGVLGAILWKWQGFGVFGKLRAGMIQGMNFGDTLLDGALIFFAGGLLLTPGILTDVFGFLLLIPVTRSVFKKMIMAWIKNKFNVMVSTQMQGMDLEAMMRQQQNAVAPEEDDEDIIEGEIVSRSEPEDAS